MPPTISVKFQGTVKEFQQSFQGLSVLLIVAILVIYIVLGILYESFIHPVTILSGLPSAVFGALLTLRLFHKELDLYAFVGLIGDDIRTEIGQIGIQEELGIKA